MEANFDVLTGPSHNFAGLAHGNLAAQANALNASNPKAAALQHLEKIKFISELASWQGVLPPHNRPHFPVLRELGFTGTEMQILEKAAKQAPMILAACYSSSSMWAANAVTVSPSPDTADGKIHLTPANLVSQLHRGIETDCTSKVLRQTFQGDTFVHHRPLPKCLTTSDEGAANHIRLCAEHDQPGIEIFVYGRTVYAPTSSEPKRYPARQTFEASAAVSRLHFLRDDATVFLLQNPYAIDAGVFHNDVISVGNERVFLFHEESFADSKAIDLIKHAFEEYCKCPLVSLKVSSKDLPLKDAVDSYIFNSQLLTTTDGRMALVAPIECKENVRSRQVLEYFRSESRGTISDIYFLDVRESMRNGGGPACLRFRMVLNESEFQHVKPSVWFDMNVYCEAMEVINKYYRDNLELNDLRDPNLLIETRTALDEISQILGYRDLYDFQRN